MSDTKLLLVGLALVAVLLLALLVGQGAAVPTPAADERPIVRVIKLLWRAVDLVTVRESDVPDDELYAEVAKREPTLRSAPLVENTPEQPRGDDGFHELNHGAGW